MKKIKKFLKKNPGLVMIFFLFIAIFLILSPVFEFPLNDSWAHAKSVKNLAENQEIKISEWTAASFVFQMFYGYVFTVPFGFSFTALRISTIVLSFFGIAAFYFILKELKFTETIATFASLVLFFNPIYFNLSYTFMTDVPFISLVLISTLFFVKAVKNEDNILLLLGTIFSIFAFLIRQHGLIVPIAVFIFLLLNKKYSLKFRKITTLLILPIMSFLIYQLWYFFVHGQTIRYLSTEHLTIGLSTIFRIGIYSFITFNNISLYLLPLVIIYLLNIKRFIKEIRLKNFIILFGLFFVCLLAGNIVYFLKTKSFSFLGYQGYILNANGLGPKLLAGSLPNMFPIYVWWFLVIIAITLGSFLAIVIIKKEYEILRKFNIKKLIKERLNTNTRDLTLFIGALIFAFLILLSSVYDLYLVFFDRYFTALLPFFIILFLGSVIKFKNVRRVLLLTIVIFAVFSFIGTQEYINWNKARWYATTTLMQNNISEKQIDGGFEFNGWFTYEYALENLSQEDIRHPSKKDTISWWFVIDDEYIISFSELENYKTIKKLEYKSYLFPGKQYVYVLKRV